MFGDIHGEIIQYLIDKYNFKTYLEIGVACGYNYNNIKCDTKESNDVIDYDEDIVQIKYDITYLMPSDEMFAIMPIDKKYDLIFIDGMHDEDYADRDIINALKHLNKNGLICVHDTVPQNNFAQVSYECFSKQNNKPWNGTTWKSITKLQNNNIEFYTIYDILSGLTIIKYKDNPHHLDIPNYKSNIRYEYIFTNDNKVLTEQGKYIMHGITVEDFKNIF